MILLGSLFLGAEILVVVWFKFRINSNSNFLQIIMSFPTNIALFIPCAWTILGVILAIKSKDKRI